MNNNNKEIVYITQDCLTGTRIDCFSDYEDADEAIRDYEQEDVENDTYEDDFYEIVVAYKYSNNDGTEEFEVLDYNPMEDQLFELEVDFVKVDISDKYIDMVRDGLDRFNKGERTIYIKDITGGFLCIDDLVEEFEKRYEGDGYDVEVDIGINGKVEYYEMDKNEQGYYI